MRATRTGTTLAVIAALALGAAPERVTLIQIGRASCRERV